VFVWRVARATVAPMIKVLWRVRVSGREHIPKQGPAVLASNHLSIMDHFVLPLATWRPIYYMSKAEHFDHRVRGWLAREFGAIPLRRGEGDQKAFQRAVDVLQEGRLFGIYPEGTRSLDGRLYKGHLGAARIAVAGRAPIVPCAMVNTEKALPKGKTVPRLARLEVRIGPAIDTSAFWGQEVDRSTLRDITDSVMLAIQELSGQEYVGEYHPHPAYARGAGGQATPEASPSAEETARAGDTDDVRLAAAVRAGRGGR
jgi:1-acyl-sn-glycerol-3-phosphate acyltransferase